MKYKLHKFLLLITLAFALTSQAALASMEELRSHIKTKQFEQGYQLALTMMEEKVGTPTFDYYLGVVSLETGRYSEAIFAFERIMMNKQNSEIIEIMNGHNAKIVEVALGEAKMKLGQAEGKAALVALQREKLSPLTEARINKLLRSYDTPISNASSLNPGSNSSSRPGAGSGTSILAFLELSGGNDSNINSTTDSSDPFGDGSVYIPPDSIGTKDNFTQVGIGTAIAHKSDGSSYGLGFGGRSRQNSSVSTYDTTVFTTYASANFGSNRHRIHIPVYLQDLNLDGGDYFTYLVTSIAYRFHTNKSNYMGLSYESGAHSYDVLTQRDSTTTTAAFNWKQSFINKKSFFKLRIYSGAQDPDNVFTTGLNQNDYFARSFSGISLNGNYGINAKHFAYGKIRSETSSYDDAPYANITPTTYREDTYLRYALGWKWNFKKNLLLRAEYNTTENDSNVAIQKYDRNQFLLGIRYTYK